MGAHPGTLGSGGAGTFSPDPLVFFVFFVSPRFLKNSRSPGVARRPRPTGTRARRDRGQQWIPCQSRLGHSFVCLELGLSGTQQPHSVRSLPAGGATPAENRRRCVTQDYSSSCRHGPWGAESRAECLSSTRPSLRSAKLSCLRLNGGRAHVTHALTLDRVESLSCSRQKPIMIQQPRGKQTLAPSLPLSATCP